MSWLYSSKIWWENTAFVILPSSGSDYSVRYCVVFCKICHRNIPNDHKPKPHHLQGLLLNVYSLSAKEIFLKKVSFPKPSDWVQAFKCGHWGTTEVVSVKTDQGLPHARHSWMQQSYHRTQMSTSATIKWGKIYLRRVTKCRRVKKTERKKREDEEFKEEKQQEHQVQRRIKERYSADQ